MDHDTELVKADIARRIHQQQLPPTASPVYDLPHLPLEIWGQFLLQLDDPFTLWVTCRRISRRFKLEAEHAFRMAMLPHLQMAWSFGTPLSAPRFEVKAELSPNVKPSCHEDNTQIAGFTFPTSGTADPNWALTFSKAKCAAHAAFAVNYKDINLRHRDERYYRWGYPMQFPYHSLCVSFTNCSMPENCYVNDPETEPIWINLNYSTLEKTPSEASDQPAQGSTKAGSIFFNWHALLKAFFTEIVFVARHLNRPPNLPIDFTSLLAKAKNNITSQCKYLRPQAASATSLHGIISGDEICVKTRGAFYSGFYRSYMANDQVEDALYVEAYERRLQLAFERKHMVFKRSCADDALRLRGHVERLRDARVLIVREYAESLWDAEFGGIEFEYEDVEGEVGFIASDFD